MQTPTLPMRTNSVCRASGFVQVALPETTLRRSHRILRSERISLPRFSGFRPRPANHHAAPVSIARIVALVHIAVL
jgi:hypothetical protein